MPRSRRFFGVALGLALSLCVSGVARAQMLSVSETEDLVRASYFEGMPEEAAARIGPAGAERLVIMLSDPAEASSHAQILLALGLCGSPDSRSAILGWAATLADVATAGRVMASGGGHAGRLIEIDRDTFKAWQALPHALGSLSKFEPLAVADLEAWMDAEAPDWTFRQFEGARLGDLARRSAATSLARTGLLEARRALDRAGRNASDLRFEAHLHEARKLHADRVRERTR